LDRPVKVSNDANVAALGEAVYGAAKNYNDSIMLTLGTGVGGGIIIGKKIYEGNESKGAEVGHAVIVVGGEPCNCGRRGCLETYCSATALIRETKRAMLEDKSSLMWKHVNGDIEAVDGETSFACEKLGDAAAAKVVKNYVFYLAESIMNFCNIFRPEAIVLGGGVCAQGDNLLSRVVELCERGYYGYKGTPKVDILIAELKNDAGILGAASL
jgi:glucokinase